MRRFSPRFVVLDPVMMASSGDLLIAARRCFGDKVANCFPALDCLTPNLAEAAALLGEALAGDEVAMARQAPRCSSSDRRAVLMKGGHLQSSEAVDILVDAERDAGRVAGTRIASRNLHGTECTLSAAIAAQIVVGRELREAVAAAKAFVTGAIEAGRDLTLGFAPGPLFATLLDRFKSSWKLRRSAVLWRPLFV